MFKVINASKELLLSVYRPLLRKVKTEQAATTVRSISTERIRVPATYRRRNRRGRERCCPSGCDGAADSRRACSLAPRWSPSSRRLQDRVLRWAFTYDESYCIFIYIHGFYSQRRVSSGAGKLAMPQFAVKHYLLFQYSLPLPISNHQWHRRPTPQRESQRP